MSALEAARLGDQIGHTSAMKGLLAGLVAGFVITGVILLAAGATVATGGAAAVVIGALIAGTAGGGLAGMKIGATFESDPKGPIITGSPNTFLGTFAKPAARATRDQVQCMDHALKFIAQGSLDVFINQLPAARRTDMTVCSGKIREGQPDVFFGGPTGTYMDLESEVPGWLVTTLTWAAIIGAGIATGGAIFTVGIGAALGGLGGSLLGGWAGGALGAKIGHALGGERGEAIGEAAGGFLGSLVGGGLGAKGGMRVENRLPTSTLARLPGSTPAKIAARQQVAREFYEGSPDFQTNGVPQTARIESHMSGIDFTKPVQVKTITENTTLAQFQNKGGSTGNYIARPGAKPTELGIGDMGRAPDGSYGPKMMQNYDVPAGTKVLVSTASPKNDNFGVGSWETTKGSGVYWEEVMQPSTGGGEQMMIGNKGVMTANGPPKQVDPSLLNPDTPTTFQPGTTTTTAPVRVPNPPQVPVRGDGVYTPTNVPGTGASTGVGAGTAVGTSGGSDPNPNKKP
jgi:uncharacterized Zn-binding protein involved in type VI secretion